MSLAELQTVSVLIAHIVVHHNNCIDCLLLSGLAIGQQLSGHDIEPAFHRSVYDLCLKSDQSID